MSDPVLTARAALGVAQRRSRGGAGGDPAAVDAARRQLAAAKVERAIKEAIAAAPPITNEQRHELALLLTGGTQ